MYINHTNLCAFILLLVNLLNSKHYIYWS